MNSQIDKEMHRVKSLIKQFLSLWSLGLSMVACGPRHGNFENLDDLLITDIEIAVCKYIQISGISVFK